MPDSISTLALRVDSQSAISNLNKFGVAATALGGTVGALQGRIIQLGSAFLSVNFAKRLVAEAAEGQETLGKYEAVMGRFVKNADKLTAELRESFNFSTTAAQASIATMTDTFAKSGLALKQSFEFTSDLQKRAADIEAFTNAEGGVARVSEALTKGILGNYMSLRTLGIVLNDDMLKTQMAEDKLKGLTFATTNAAKMHARYVLIMKQSASSAGQVARESDNFSNRLRKLRAVSADLRNELGDVIIPLATKLVTGAEKVTRALEGTSDATKTFVVAGGASVAMLGALAPWILRLVAGYKSYRAAKIQATAAEEANNVASRQTTLSKEREAAARIANAQAIQAENLALNVQTRSNVATSFGNIPSKAEKRAAKIAWRAQTEGARKFASLPGAMSMTSKGTAQLGKTVAKGAFGKAGAFANLAPMFGKLTAPLGKLNGVLGKTFTTIVSKVPLLTRFSGVLGKCLGLFGTAGAVVGGVVLALQAFKNAPQWLEQFLDTVGPKIADFGKKIPDYLWSGITGGIELAKKGAESAGKLVVDAMVGGAQFGKRLLGFETEASRAYKLNKQIEENNKKRAELLEAQRKQLAEENANLEQQKMAAQARLDAELKFNATKDTDAVKLEKARRDLLQANVDRQNASGAEQIADANEAWLKASEAVAQLEDSVHNAAKSFDDDQKTFAKAKQDSALELENARAQMGLESADSYAARQAAMKADAERTQKRLEASQAASGEADAINERITKINDQLNSGSVARALADLEELVKTGDLSGDAAIKFAGATNALEKAGYDVGDRKFVNGVPRQILEQITNRRKSDQELLGDLVNERDEKLARAGEQSSLEQELASKNREIANNEKEYRERQAEERRQEEEQRRQKARADAQFQRGLGDAYFNRQLSAIDLTYGDDKLGASRARYSLIGQRGFADWNRSQSDLYAQQTQIDALSARLSILDQKNGAGTLTDDEAKQRDLLRSQIETLRSEYDSDYQDAIQKRLATEDELLGLENTMREEYLSEAQKWVDETTNQWKEQALAQAQAAEEEQRKRLEERSRVEEEARQAVSGMRAIASGSSEAFNIASKIYDRGREELPPEKKIEKSTQQIEAYVKAMQEQMLNYFREQSLNGMTLSMGY